MLFDILSTVRGLGAAGIPLLIVCEMVFFLALLPISPIHLGIGVLYGFWPGLALSWLAYTVGCVPPFLLAKTPLVLRACSRLRHSEVIEGVMKEKGVIRVTCDQCQYGCEDVAGVQSRNQRAS